MSRNTWTMSSLSGIEYNGVRLHARNHGCSRPLSRPWSVQGTQKQRSDVAATSKSCVRASLPVSRSRQSTTFAACHFYQRYDLSQTLFWIFSMHKHVCKPWRSRLFDQFQIWEAHYLKSLRGTVPAIEILANSGCDWTFGEIIL